MRLTALIALLPAVCFAYEPPTPYSFGAAGNCVADDTVAMQSWLNSGARHLALPVPSTCYRVTATLSVPSTVEIIEGVGGRHPLIKNEASSEHVISIYQSDGLTIRNIGIDGESGVKTYGAGIAINDSQNITIENFHIEDTKAQGITVFGGSSRITLRDGNFENIGHMGIRLTDVAYSTVTGMYFTNCAQFGVQELGDTHHNLINGLFTTDNGLELLVAEETAHHNIHYGLFASGTGDNGVTFIGDSNVLMGAVFNTNANNGLAIVGQGNIASGVVAYDNNQSSSNFKNTHIIDNVNGPGDGNILLGISGEAFVGMGAGDNHLIGIPNLAIAEPDINYRGDYQK